jgi:transcriptional regulator with XRE-family HTH domain
MPLVSTVRVDGQALRELRISRALSLRQLGKLASRHPQAIRKLETSPGKLASDIFAAQLAKALGVDVSEFTIADGEADSTEPELAAAS